MGDKSQGSPATVDVRSPGFRFLRKYDRVKLLRFWPDINPFYPTYQAYWNRRSLAGMLLLELLKRYADSLALLSRRKCPWCENSTALDKTPHRINRDFFLNLGAKHPCCPSTSLQKLSSFLPA